MGYFSRLFSSRKAAGPTAAESTAPAPAKESREKVSFDDERVTRTLADGRQESVRWDELIEVGIMTTDQGPFLDDVFWVLQGVQGGCIAPSEAEGTGELIIRLQQLPGFDNAAVVKAMGSTQNASFVCWRLGSEPVPFERRQPKK